MTVASDISTRENRGRTMSVLNGTVFLGTGVGPIVGGLVAQSYGMQAPFFLTAFLGLAATLWALWRIPETRRLAEGPKTGESPLESSIPAAGGLRPLLLNANFLLVGLIGFSLLFTNTGARNVAIPLLGYSKLALSEAQVGFVIAMISVADVLVIFFGGMVSDRFGRKVVIVPAFAVAAVSLVLFAQGDSYAFFLFSAAVYGIGRGIAGSAPAAYALDIAPQGSYGPASGLYRTFCDVGLMLGPVTLGWIADVASLSWALYFNAGLLLFSALLFGVLARETAGQHSPEAFPSGG